MWFHSQHRHIGYVQYALSTVTVAGLVAIFCHTLHWGC